MLDIPFFIFGRIFSERALPLVLPRFDVSAVHDNETKWAKTTFTSLRNNIVNVYCKEMLSDNVYERNCHDLTAS